MVLKEPGLSLRRKKMDNELIDNINLILAKWNPLEVPEIIADSEYSSYVDYFLSIRNNQEDIKKQLIRILINDLGLEYSENNNFQKKEIDTVASEIFCSIQDYK